MTYLYMGYVVGSFLLSYNTIFNVCIKDIEYHHMKYHVSSKADLEITNYYHYILLYKIFLLFQRKNGPATYVARPLLSNTIFSSSPYPPSSLSAASVSSPALRLSSD